MNLFDSHAHMDDERFDGDRAELLADFPEKGVRYLMNAACDLESSKAGIRLASEYDWIYCAVGSHPDDADHVDEERIEIYRRLARENPKVRAVGEIGLDYHYEDVPREIQQKAFRMQMRLAKELGLPAVKLIRCGGDDAMAAQREQWNDGSNTLCIAHGKVITYERNYVTNDLLDKNGIDVLTMPSSELSRGRGGPRCMSCPVNRDDL